MCFAPSDINSLAEKLGLRSARDTSPPISNNLPPPTGFVTLKGKHVENTEVPKEKEKEQPGEIEVILLKPPKNDFEGLIIDTDEIKRNLEKQGVMMNAEGRW